MRNEGNNEPFVDVDSSPMLSCDSVSESRPNIEKQKHSEWMSIRREGAESWEQVMLPDYNRNQFGSISSKGQNQIYSNPQHISSIDDLLESEIRYGPEATSLIQNIRPARDSDYSNTYQKDSFEKRSNILQKQQRFMPYMREQLPEYRPVEDTNMHMPQQQTEFLTIDRCPTVPYYSQNTGSTGELRGFRPYVRGLTSERRLVNSGINSSRVETVESESLSTVPYYRQYSNNQIDTSQTASTRHEVGFRPYCKNTAVFDEEQFNSRLQALNENRRIENIANRNDVQRGYSNFFRPHVLIEQNTVPDSTNLADRLWIQPTAEFRDDNRGKLFLAPKPGSSFNRVISLPNTQTKKINRLQNWSTQTDAFERFCQSDYGTYQRSDLRHAQKNVSQQQSSLNFTNFGIRAILELPEPESVPKSTNKDRYSPIIQSPTIIGNRIENGIDSGQNDIEWYSTTQRIIEKNESNEKNLVPEQKQNPLFKRQRNNDIQQISQTDSSNYKFITSTTTLNTNFKVNQYKSFDDNMSNQKDLFSKTFEQFDRTPVYVGPLAPHASPITNSVDNRCDQSIQESPKEYTILTNIPNNPTSFDTFQQKSLNEKDEMEEETSQEIDIQVIFCGSEPHETRSIIKKVKYVPNANEKALLRQFENEDIVLQNQRNDRTSKEIMQPSGDENKKRRCQQNFEQKSKKILPDAYEE